MSQWKRTESISVHEFLEDTRSGGMVGVCVGITSDVDRDTRVRAKDVFNYHGKESHGYCPFLLEASCRQVDPYVSCGGKSRDVQDERKDKS